MAKLLYMFLTIGVESRDFFQAEKQRATCKAEQIHKMTIIFTQNADFFSSPSILF